jgi:hypothetical protein
MCVAGDIIDNIYIITDYTEEQIDTYFTLKHPPQPTIPKTNISPGNVRIVQAPYTCAC